MEAENTDTTDQWFDSTLTVLTDAYQLDLHRLMSPDTYELAHALSDFYMYDASGLFIHLLGLTSHYLTPTSFVYADNQLKHRLNLHLLLVVRAGTETAASESRDATVRSTLMEKKRPSRISSGYERCSLVEHIKQAMSNVQSIHQTGQPFDARHKHGSAIFSSDLCLSDRFDEHGTDAHVQRHESVCIVGTSNGHFIRKQLESKRRHRQHVPREADTHWLTFFLASQARVFCRRAKFFDPNRYPSLEQWILVIHCHCSSPIDFYFDELQANQFMCDYLDTLSLKGRPTNV